MLSRFDDYPIHQTPEPVAHPATSDRNAYDRTWFNGYDRDGEFYFALGIARYPHRGIVDCGFSVVRDGVEHSFLASRRASDEPSDMSVGPFRLEVVEPMRRARLVIEPNETGVECDLRFTARTACVEEGRQTLHRGMRIMMDATRFAQFGSWEGRIAAAGKTLDVAPSRVPGTKDRSWGIRPVGEPETGGAPSLELPQFFFLWAPVHWDDHCTHFGVFEDEAGHRWHRDGAVVPAYAKPDEIPGVEDPGILRMVDVDHRVDYQPGTRWARSAEITLVSKSGVRREIALEPLLRFQMKGIGYTHPEWGHGRWQGDLALHGESFALDEVEPLTPSSIHIQSVMRARCDGREGVGVLEQLAIGPHAPSGFESILDGAR